MNAILTGILIDLTAGVISFAEAVAMMAAQNIFYTGVATVAALAAYINQLISQPTGGTSVVATAPVPTLTQPPSCVTGGARHKGICCAAITQLGLARAAMGFQYTTCTGRTVCLACGTKASVSVKHPGQIVFSPKRVSCGPSGCPALTGAGVTPPV